MTTDAASARLIPSASVALATVGTGTPRHIENFVGARLGDRIPVVLGDDVLFG